jgi:peptidoglycan lytic transglycosylase B
MRPLRSLASLAFAKYRDNYFRDELLLALKILQGERMPRDRFVSSWAGAMGQTQFMPKNFMDLCVGPDISVDMLLQTISLIDCTAEFP